MVEQKTMRNIKLLSIAQQLGINLIATLVQVLVTCGLAYLMLPMLLHVARLLHWNSILTLLMVLILCASVFIVGMSLGSGTQDFLTLLFKGKKGGCANENI